VHGNFKKGLSLLLVRCNVLPSPAAYLISAEAGYIAGAIVIADGGMTRKMIYV
jgi:hypothetical protein